jgi:hypothetical protein
VIDLFTKSSAVLSPCGHYRYALTRTWDEDKPTICWVMLNPSTADADQDDPTIRRVVGFSRSWGAGGICVVNLFALRATDPAELARHYPVTWDEQQRNEHTIAEATDRRRTLVAWGAGGRLRGQDRRVMEMLKDRLVECLGTTKDGHPRHPLYVPGCTPPVPFELPSPF